MRKGLWHGFGPGGVNGNFVGNGSGLTTNVGVDLPSAFGVRPVVELKPDVTMDDLIVRSSGEEETWSSTPLEVDTGSGAWMEYGKITE